MTNEEAEKIFERSFEIIESIPATREALAERKWRNSLDPEIFDWEMRQRNTVSDGVLYKVNPDALAAKPAAPEQDLQRALESVVEMLGDEVGEMFAILEKRIAALEERIDKNSEDLK